MRLHLAAGLDTVAIGHRHVHQDDVRNEFLGEANGFDAVLGLADHVESLVDHRPPKTFTQHLMVVCQHQSDRVHFLAPGFVRSSGWVVGTEGSRTQVMLVPWPGTLWTSRVAPMEDARSRMPSIP